MGEKDGYISGEHTYCCECAIDVFDDDTCELEKQGDKEFEIEARAIKIQRDRNFNVSYDENQEHLLFLWLDEQNKKYGDDPDIKNSLKMFNVLDDTVSYPEFTVNAVVSDEECEYSDLKVSAVLSNEEQQSAWKISKEELYSHVKAKTILFSYVQGLPAGFLLSMLFAYIFKKD